MAAGSGCGVPDPENPNIVFLFSDTHRWGALPWTQTPAVQTPHMEAMRDFSIEERTCPTCDHYQQIAYDDSLEMFASGGMIEEVET